MTPSEKLRAVGEALFGPEWQRVLARRIGKHEKQIRRWVNEESKIPDSTWAAIADLCEAEAAERSAQAGGLFAWAKALR